MLRSYSNINAIKYRLVQRMESRLPLRAFEVEWIEAGEGRDPKRYRPLSTVEQAVAVVVMLLYVVLGVWSIARLIRGN